MALLALTVALGSLPATFTGDDGLLDRMSVALLAFAVPVSAVRLGLAGLPRHMVVPTTLFLLAEREAETGLAWIGNHLLTPGHWGGPITPTTPLEAVLLFAVLWSLATALPLGVPAFRRAWRDGRAWPRLLLAGGIMAAVAQGAEELGPAWQMVEEGLETGFALCLLRAVAGSNADAPVCRAV